MSIILTERAKTFLEYSQKADNTNPHILGHLSGIGADFKKPTRNGRLYPRELWQNVLNSEDYKEGMETLTIFGETDHPETRVDSSLKEVAMVLTDMRIDDSDGVVYVEFDILDTPQGRILKELCEYGSKIGVSSRGLGDEIQKDGQTMIDPNTYTFYGFDAVVTPAVKSARPNKVESVKRAKVTDIFKAEVENATTVAELNSLKRLAESVNMPNLVSITETIDNKINGVAEGDNITEQLEADLGSLADENENLRKQVENLKKKLSANNIRVKTEKESTMSLKNELNEARKEIAMLKQQIRFVEKKTNNKIAESRDFKVQLESLKRVNSNVLREKKNDLNGAMSDISYLKSEVSKLRKELKESHKIQNSYVDEISGLKELNENSNNTIRELRNQNKSLANDVENIKADNVLIESDAQSKLNTLNSRLVEAHNQVSQKDEVVANALNKYLETKCASEGINVNNVKGMLPNNFTIEDVDRIVSEMSDRKRRLDKLPFTLNTQSIPIRLEESLNVSDEDSQTLRFLQNFQ